MPELIIIDDPLHNAQHTRALRHGARLGIELMRIFPDGLPSGWRIYRRSVKPGNEIPVGKLTREIITADASYVLVQSPGDVTSIIINFAISAMLSMISRMLAPSTRVHRPRNEGDDENSANNMISAQGNLLRPGARVPEILGKVRAYPDLLTVPVEEWSERTQSIEQYFVLGVGEYLVEEGRLGDTLTTAMSNAGWFPFPPGTELGMRVIKNAPEVNGLSLMTDQSAVVPATGVNFNGGGVNTIVVPAPGLGLAVNDYIVVKAAGANNGFYKVTSVSGTGPYTYGVDKALTTATGIDPLFETYRITTTWSSVALLFEDNDVSTIPSGTITGSRGPWANGTIVDMSTPTKGTVRGYLRNLTVTYTEPVISGPPIITLRFNVEKIDGTLYDFGTPQSGGGSGAVLYLTVPYSGSGGGGGTEPPPGPIQPAPSDWYRVPIDVPFAVWLDFAFPQGIVKYNSGARQYFEINIKVEFRRPSTPSAPAQVTYNRPYNRASSGPMRFTEKFELDTLISDGLPSTGTGIEVRVTRTTPIATDTATLQYIQESVWERLAAIVIVDTTYDDVTILQLTMNNDRGAVSAGDLAFNVLATRKLNTWTPGGGWSATKTATRKWFPNMVQRMKAADGANRTDDADIDLAGMYSLQQALDAIDTAPPYSAGNGAQGQISMTLDQRQDIDSELQQIADVVRAQVYRVGRKLYVIRDQQGTVITGLFNARAKSPQGEAIVMRMQNEGDNDGVTVTWMDEFSAWKWREYTYPDTGAPPINPLGIGARLANWPQAYRRALFEMNRIKYRRQQMSCDVTQDGRLCRPGDIIMMTDDIANLAISAGEVVAISGLTLVLDRPVTFGTGTHSLVLREAEGRLVDIVAVTSVAGNPNKVTLARTPTVEIKPRDLSLGTLFSFYNDAKSNLIRWLITGVDPSGPYVKLNAVNYDPVAVWGGDTASLPARPTAAVFARLRNEGT